MLQFVSALFATGYIVSVIIFAFFTLCAFDKPFTRELFANRLRRYLFMVEVMSSGVTESCLHLILIKLTLIKLVNYFDGFRYSFSKLAYIVDIINMLSLLVFFYEMLTEKAIADTTIQSIDNKRGPIDSIVCTADMKKLINPVWTPDDIKVHPNITYATNEEIREALVTTNHDFNQPRKMMLDIYTHKNNTTAGLKPVLIHIHGGAWMMGSKNIFYPYEKLLVKENDWVIVNIGYRLAPKNAYPTHLKDVKRAIRWIKQNIVSFGGDPEFIVLAGDSAGAHLAAMASMTANDPQYQPGFESVDTSVRGVISLSGALDMATNAHHAIFFCKKVAQLSKLDSVFLTEHSPAAMIQVTKDKDKLVPFLLISGERDGLTESKMSKLFKSSYDDAVGPENNDCTLVLLPGGHHVSYVGWSPRSLYVARVIQSWCTQLYIKNYKK
ncbi:Alpha/Beta hydrolase protein [Cokeromyces recurvatus]|uniref:Alpha/Beta hydrolase protein n=1 Tax=Cokeromyces recurvatus TaxID=90255 RepID=UPI002220E3BF|nr:Alpha/Beta hydrolase protein [Cokeromyces recurvatus]KAI7905375.1 Alpha/Beta hydrolase protein [Cokeromyces recurvatus]